MSTRSITCILSGLALALFAWSGVCGAPPSVAVTPSGPAPAWEVTVSASDLAAPGGELPDAIESEPNHTIVDVTAAGNWEVYVRRVDGVWPAGLAFYVLRTGDGTSAVPEGFILGGNGAPGVEVTATDRLFFEGFGDRQGITVQLAIGNLSLATLPGFYSTTVTYTVVGE